MLIYLQGVLSDITRPESWVLQEGWRPLVEDLFHFVFLQLWIVVDPNKQGGIWLHMLAALRMLRLLRLIPVLKVPTLLWFLTPVSSLVSDLVLLLTLASFSAEVEKPVPTASKRRLIVLHERCDVNIVMYQVCIAKYEIAGLLMPIMKLVCTRVSWCSRC